MSSININSLVNQTTDCNPDAILWETEKARLILSDLIQCFDCADLDNPPESKLRIIKFRYKSIVALMASAIDALDNIDMMFADDEAV